MRREETNLGVARSWGEGSEVIVLSNPLADPAAWSAGLRDTLLPCGYQVTTFEHRPQRDDWRSVVDCVSQFIANRPGPVALVGWSQGAAIAQEAALVSGEKVTCAALLATYGRQNEADRVLQACWSALAAKEDDLDPVRLAMGFLTAFTPAQLADDEFVRQMSAVQASWAGRPDPQKRRRASVFIDTYQDRLGALGSLTAPCLILGFELDTDTFAARAREVADAIPDAVYAEIPGVAHAAPLSAPELVWPLVASHIREHRLLR